MDLSEVGQGLFNQQRLQVMQIGASGSQFTDAYLYAWVEGVYPYLEDTDGSVMQLPHEPYNELFMLQRATVSAFLDALDTAAMSNTMPTFNVSGNHVQIQGTRASCLKRDLSKICRYFYLGHSWDAEFWDLLFASEPTLFNASHLKRNFDRTQISFM